MRLDPLSLTFVLLITGVGGLIHLYAVGYMANDAGRRRFFAQFNLFIAAMLLLVLGNNYLTLYVGWEGVGLASYLLIGYYFSRNSAATAAKKAFLQNRVGDAGLSIAIMIMFGYFGTTSFAGVFDSMSHTSKGVAAALGFMLAQGLSSWNKPDAAERWLQPDTRVALASMEAYVAPASRFVIAKR